MWKQLESYNNHYLQWKLKHLEPEFINNLVNKEFKETTEKRDRCIFPTELKCEHSTHFHDRSQLAYGWFALPKLMRELCSDKHLLQWRAINTLSEYLLNPLQAQRAIKEMDIVRKLHNCFLRIRFGYRKEEYSEIWRILRIFEILSIYLNGAEKIGERKHLLNVFYAIIYNKEKYEVLTGKILRNLSEKPEVLLILMETLEPFEHMTRIFHKDVCAPHYDFALWQHLSHFLDYAPELGIAHGFFELLHRRIMGKLPEYHRMNMKCFALLLRCEEGQKRFAEIDGIMLFHNIMQRVLDTYEYVMLALLQGLQGKKTLWRCREFIDLPDIVLLRGNETRNSRTQLYCLQTIRQLGQMPCIKRYMQTICKTGLRNLNVRSSLNECNRDELIIWLNREIYETEC